MWAELHNPGSRMISVRQLNPLTMKSTARLSVRKEEMNLKEFERSQDMRMAVMALESAVHMIMPWNHSFKALANFLNTVEFGEKLGGDCEDRLAFVADFIDEVMAENADAWDNKANFLSCHEIGTKWHSEVSLKFGMADGTGSRQGKNQDSAHRKSTPVKDAMRKLCRKFNAGECKIKDDFHPAHWDSGINLKHACSFFDKAKNRVCMEKHPKIEHK